ncbi:M20/M25/M40 family metallo-hydrolase [Paraherbaspirillum soli]|uniref:M20/M25/M40 family metallo-hydrolase n=1 Tax=Paraherbaspirillum soli TaxID=631222 RepID=A0ABW0M790_9BURK
MDIRKSHFAISGIAPKIAALLAAGLFVGSTAAMDTKKVWITVGDAAYAQLQKVAPQAIARESRITLTNQASSRFTGTEKVHLVEVDEQQLLKLSAAVHQELKRCGGFMFHPSESAGRKALNKPLVKRPAAARPAYAIGNQAIVTPMLAQMQDSNIVQTIVDMAAFDNRYYATTNGANASNWLLKKWTDMTAGRSDISVAQFSHPNWGQKSVILTIKGSDNPAEVVVLGAHLDTINMNGTYETTIAPGADDDASGIASLTEALRVMLANGYKPRRTIKIIGYAAEEVGLRGSQEIAQNFKDNNVNVVGVMQLDMTNYQGSSSDIYLYTDYTNSQQNDFVAKLISTYLPTLSIGYDQCGYACSDHASWDAQGYPTSMPFEAAFSQYNPYIHTSDDTYANSGSQAAHALKFARLAAAYAVELGSEGSGGTPPADKVETFSGSLTKGQKKTYGPYKVGAGGSIKAALSGSGDTDLYVRKAAAPSTTTYDCKSDGPTSTENCALNMAANGDVYLLLNGYAASSYKLTVSYRPQ